MNYSLKRREQQTLSYTIDVVGVTNKWKTPGKHSNKPCITPHRHTSLPGPGAYPLRGRRDPRVALAQALARWRREILDRRMLGGGTSSTPSGADLGVPKRL